MTEMFGEAWSPMSVPDLAPDDDDACKGIINYNVNAHLCMILIDSYLI